MDSNFQLSEENKSIVIDNGTGMIKAGISNEEAPRACFPTLIGRPKYNMIMHGLENKEIYIGNDAKAR